MEIWGKNSIKNKKNLRTFLLLENNQPAPQCLAKRKKKTLTELTKLICKSVQYITLSKIRIPEKPEPTYLGFTYQIIRVIQTKECWPKAHFIDKATTRKNKKSLKKKEILVFYVYIYMCLYIFTGSCKMIS